MVRADVLGLPRDAVGARHRHHRRRVHAARRDLLDGVRHDRRPAPQAPRDDLRRGGDAGRRSASRARSTCCSPSRRCSTSAARWFWIFSGIILFGAVIENMRNIALSTTVTLLVPEERHANANGMVGTVQGLAFLVTSVFSGLSIGLLGMGWTLADRDRAVRRPRSCTCCFLRIPEEQPERDGRAGAARRLPRQHARPCAPRPGSSR